VNHERAVLSEWERRALREIADATIATDAALVHKLTASTVGRVDQVARRAAWVFAGVVLALLTWGMILADKALLAGAALVLVTFPGIVWIMARARRVGT
jgi:Protein of unknown function (DUF3040)